MQKTQPALFRRRHFQDHVIALCVRSYLRYCLTLRDLEELMAERGLALDHSTLAVGYSGTLLSFTSEFVGIPALRTDCGDRQKTYVRVAGRWTYLYRAVDSSGETIDFMLS